MWGRADDGDLVEVSAWMRRFAAEPLEASTLPSLQNPAILWWKAQLLERWDAQQQVAAPLNAGEDVQAALAAVASLVLLSWVWRDLLGKVL